MIKFEEKENKIIRNSAKCKLCEDEIQSHFRWDFKSCKCGEIFVDGGNDYLRRGANNWKNFIDTSLPAKESKKKEKILFWDVETSESIVKTFSLFNVNIPYKKIVQDWFIICGSWKFQDEDEVYSVSKLNTKWDDDIKNDYEIVKQLREAVLEADIIVHHNGDRFDLRKLNTRLIYHRLPPLPTKLTTVDTLKEAKHSFAFTSNRLDYLGKYLGVGQKIKTDDDLWARVLEGQTSAIEEMVEYNKGDVRLLENIYEIMAPYIRHPNLAALASNDPGLCCKLCKSTHIQYRGNYITKLGVKKRYQCQDCGKWDHESHYSSKTILKAA